MAACSGDFEGTFGLRLAFHFRKVGVIRWNSDGLPTRARHLLPASQVSADVEQGARLVDNRPAH